MKPTTRNIRKNSLYGADPGFNGKKNLYDMSLKRGFQLVCPVKRYKNTPVERLKLLIFMSRLRDRWYILGERSS